MAQERYERGDRDLAQNIDVNMRPQIRLGGNEIRLTGGEGREVADQCQIMQQQNVAEYVSDRSSWPDRGAVGYESNRNSRDQRNTSYSGNRIGGRGKNFV